MADDVAVKAGDVGAKPAVPGMPAPPPGSKGVPPPGAPTPRPPAIGGLAMEGLMLVILLAAATTGAVRILRRLASEKLLAGPPLGCDVCSAWWVGLIFTAAWWKLSGLRLDWPAGLWFGCILLAVVGVAHGLLKKIGPDD